MRGKYYGAVGLAGAMVFAAGIWTGAAITDAPRDARIPGYAPERIDRPAPTPEVTKVPMGIPCPGEPDEDLYDLSEIHSSGTWRCAYTGTKK